VYIVSTQDFKDRRFGVHVQCFTHKAGSLFKAF